MSWYSASQEGRRGSYQEAVALIKRAAKHAGKSADYIGYLVDGFFNERGALYYVWNYRSGGREYYELLRLDGYQFDESSIARTGSADADELLDIAERLAEMSD
jgi:hypothetical protein